jgi:hypothetical protein
VPLSDSSTFAVQLRFMIKEKDQSYEEAMQLLEERKNALLKLASKLDEYHSKINEEDPERFDSSGTKES